MVLATWYLGQESVECGEDANERRTLTDYRPLRGMAATELKGGKERGGDERR
jgi:hypothetical protein